MDQRAMLQAGFRYALSLCHNRAEAKDLVQEAWVRLLGRYADITRALLFTCIRHRWIDLGRRPRVVIGHDDPDGLGATVIPAARLQRDDINAALSRLRPEEREAIYLSVVEGYTAAEISDIVDKPRGTVLSLIHRGKQKLHDLLAEPELDGLGAKPREVLP